MQGAAIFVLVTLGLFCVFGIITIIESQDENKRDH